MKPNWLSLVLLLMSGATWAQPGELSGADLTENTKVMNPLEVMKAVEGQWLAFSVPALADTRSPCCWMGKWNGMGEVGCSLETAHQSYGTRSDSPLAENLVVFSRIHDGKVSDLRVIGESCPVDAGGAAVTWIGNVGNTAGLDWLENTARSDRNNSGGSALMAMAMHRSPEAGQRLYSLAKEKRSDVAKGAIFWLGENRGEQGLSMLKQLLAELPRGDRRREINFALAQNNTPEAAQLLFEISKADPDAEQRGQAMFWLAQEYPQQAQAWLLELIATEQDEDVLEQAVFAVSQLPKGNGDKILLDLAKNAQASRTVRRQAIFWLAQSDNESGVDALTALLTR
ncbi:MAG TPA: hypothetical protein VIS57_11395 [Xanthomonadales bacterium]